MYSGFLIRCNALVYHLENFLIIYWLSGIQRLLYLCYNKHSGKQVDDESCKYLTNPAGKPAVCQRNPCQNTE